MPGEPGAAVTNKDEAGTSGKPTHATRRTAKPAARQPESAITTAEIPRVAPAPSPQFPHSADGWHPDIEQRLPAPWGLEIAVWALFVLFVLGLIGLAAEHFHPSWVAIFRNTVQTSHRRAAHGTTTSTTPSSSSSSTTQPTAGLGKLALVSSTKTGLTYSVPTSTGFTLVVSTANPCWIAVKSPPKSLHYLFAATITPKQSPAVIKLKGPASVLLGARASALVVKVGSKTIGAIETPRPILTYTFVPTHH
jgi:hypothetical protein